MNRLFELEKELAQYSKKGQQHTLNSPANAVSTAQSLRGGFSKAMGNGTKICILSIDGGGIRGLIPALILEEIERRIRKRISRENAFVQEFFDFFAGTSTGGILTAGMLVPRKEGHPQNSPLVSDLRPPRPAGYEYSISELAGIYSSETREEIFCGRMLGQPSSGLFAASHERGGINTSLKKRKGIDAVLAEKFGSDLNFTDLKKPVLITAVSLTLGTPRVFCNVSDNYQSDRDFFKAVDVVRSTSAAPTFFSPAKVEFSSYGKKRTEEFIDGGMFQNNPALLGFNFVQSHFHNYNNIKKRKQIAKPVETYTVDKGIDTRGNKVEEKRVVNSDIVLISLGTGNTDSFVELGKFDDSGKAGWATKAVGMVMESNSIGSHYELLTNLSTYQNYLRINPQLPQGGIEMDNISDENISLMKKTVREFISSKEGSTLIDKAVELLVQSNTW